MKFFLTLALLGFGINVSTCFANASDHVSNQIWNELLSKYVSKDGVVNYKGMKTESAKLGTYIKLLSAIAPQESWSRSEKMAYWINAYNALTVKEVLDHYPIMTIKDIDNGKVWDTPLLNVGSHKYSLNQIESEILRKEFGDPRIHFAINCASASCPKLLNEAFAADALDRQLDMLTKGFVNDPAKNKIEPNAIQVSSIFDWYKEDFTRKGTLIEFLNQYSSIKISSTASISYLKYDWSLNE